MAQKPLAKGGKKSIQKPGRGVKKQSGNKGKLYEKTKKGALLLFGDSTLAAVSTGHEHSPAKHPLRIKSTWSALFPQVE